MTILLAITIACLLLISATAVGPGYLPLLPHAPGFYPDSVAESTQVVEAALKRTELETQLFKNTDISVAKGFQDILPVPHAEIVAVANSVAPLILILKVVINRPRPNQVTPDLVKTSLPSLSANTPAFPSGHTAQAYMVANYYGRRFPSLKEKLIERAEAVGKARISAGLHYPSDHEFSKKLVSFFT